MTEIVCVKVMELCEYLEEEKLSFVSAVVLSDGTVALPEGI